MATVTIDDVRIAFYQENDKKRAVQLLQSVLSRNPTADAWYLAANLTSNEQQAVKCLRQALLLDPKHRMARTMLQQLGAEQKGLLGTISDETADTVYKHSARIPIIRSLKPYQQLILAGIMVMAAIFVAFTSISKFIDIVRGPEVAATTPEQQPVIMVSPQQVINHLTSSGITMHGLQIAFREQVEAAKGHNVRFSVADATGATYAVSIWTYDSVSDLIDDQTNINMQTVSAQVVGSTNAYLIYPKSMPADLAAELEDAFRSLTGV